MQIEKQIQLADMPVIASETQSDKSKSKRGGKRPGAGRKPNLANTQWEKCFESLQMAVGVLWNVESVPNIQARRFVLSHAQVDLTAFGI